MAMKVKTNDVMPLRRENPQRKFKKTFTGESCTPELANSLLPTFDNTEAVVIDFDRAKDLSDRQVGIREDTMRYESWLEAYTTFNDGGAPERRVKLGRGRKVRVNPVYVCTLLPGESWGNSPKTAEMYRTRTQVANKGRENYSTAKGKLHIVRNKRPFPAAWSPSMSRERTAKGLENYSRPPTVVQLLVDSHEKGVSLVPIGSVSKKIPLFTPYYKTPSYREYRSNADSVGNNIDLRQNLMRRFGHCNNPEVLMWCTGHTSANESVYESNQDSSSDSYQHFCDSPNYIRRLSHSDLLRVRDKYYDTTNSVIPTTKQAIKFHYSAGVYKTTSYEEANYFEKSDRFLRGKGRGVPDSDRIEHYWSGVAAASDEARYAEWLLVRASHYWRYEPRSYKDCKNPYQARLMILEKCYFERKIISENQFRKSLERLEKAEMSSKRITELVLPENLNDLPGDLYRTAFIKRNVDISVTGIDYESLDSELSMSDQEYEETTTVSSDDSLIITRQVHYDFWKDRNKYFEEALATKELCKGSFVKNINQGGIEFYIPDHSSKSLDKVIYHIEQSKCK